MCVVIPFSLLSFSCPTNYCALTWPAVQYLVCVLYMAYYNIREYYNFIMMMGYEKYVLGVCSQYCLSRSMGAVPQLASQPANGLLLLNSALVTDASSKWYAGMLLDGHAPSQAMHTHTHLRVHTHTHMLTHLHIRTCTHTSITYIYTLKIDVSHLYF